MKEGTVLFFKKHNDLSNIKAVSIDNYAKAQVDDRYVEYRNMKIKINTEMYDTSKVKGFITVSEKENQTEKQALENVISAINGTIAIHKRKASNEKIVGYVGINGATYALVKKSHAKLIGLLIMTGVIIVGSVVAISQFKPANEVIEEADVVESTQEDEKGTGTLDGEKLEYSSEGFRFKINVAPVISEGKMNVRIESPEAENAEFIAIYEYYINAKIDAAGNVIEAYEEPIKIYTSPKVFGNENLEFGTIQAEFDEGYYSGVCYCSIYDKEENFLMTNGAVLRIYCAD